MKTLKQFGIVAAVVASLGMLDASATELQSVTVQYGQGIPVTFYRAAQKTSVACTPAQNARVAKQGLESVHWAQQSVPNGPAVSYTVQEEPGYNIAPLK